MITLDQRQRWLNAFWEVFKMDQEDKRFPELKPILDGYVYKLYHTPLEGDPPVPPPEPPAGVLARFDAAPSNWAAWKLIIAPEYQAVLDRYPDRHNEIRLCSAFYDAGGIGSVGGYYHNGQYYFARQVNGQEVMTLDVNGAADAYVEQIAAAQGKTVPRAVR
ncbi:MAG: hypothetical protein WC809_18780 [Sinimarinibacterium sp.]|jgi:hypothetical protein